MALAFDADGDPELIEPYDQTIVDAQVAAAQAAQNAAELAQAAAEQAVLDSAAQVVLAQAQVNLATQAVSDCQDEVSLAQAQVTLAQAQVTLATAKATLAGNYANYAHGSYVPGTSEYSAKHWAQEAQGYAGGGQMRVSSDDTTLKYLEDAITLAASSALTKTTTTGGGNEHVQLDVATMTGDSGSGGVKGLVPAPATGDAAASKFLKADGTWTAVVVPPAGGSQMIEYVIMGGY
jgi:hypothetical protein